MPSEKTRNALLVAEIRAELARQKISGHELGRRVGIPPTTISRHLRGNSNLSLDEIELLAQALNVTTVDLVTRAYEKPRNPFDGGDARRQPNQAGGPTGRDVSSDWTSRTPVIPLISAEIRGLVHAA